MDLNGNTNAGCDNMSPKTYIYCIQKLLSLNGCLKKGVFPGALKTTINFDLKAEKRLGYWK